MISLNNIQKGKTMFMGLAILWVVALHYEFLRETPFNIISKYGFLGVDVFILLSSFSLCFSLRKNDNFKQFIKRRLVKIIPTWWLLITIMLILNVMIVEERGFPHTIFQVFCFYSGTGWWFFHNEPFGTYWYEWYVPTLLLFYLFVPLLYKLKKQILVLVFVVFAVTSCLLLQFDIEPGLEFSYQRMPTFVYGVLLYKMFIGDFEEKWTKKYLWISSLIGVAWFSLCVIGKMRFMMLAFMFALPLLLSICYYLFQGVANKILSFIGTLTLELYLLHLYGVPFIAVLHVVENRNVAIVITTLILIGCSYIFQIMLGRILNKLKIGKS